MIRDLTLNNRNCRQSRLDPEPKEVDTVSVPQELFPE